MTARILIAGTLAFLTATGVAEAAVAGVPTGQHAQVMSDIYRAQQRNNAAIRHVQRSIAATRRGAY